MDRILELTEKLKNTARNANSYKEIYSMVEECFSILGIMVHHLHPTYKIARIRMNEGNVRFTEISALSYKPNELSKTYQRASIPNESVFYSSSCERRTELSEPYTDDDFGIRIALFETIPELRESYLSGKGLYNPKEKDPHFNVMVDNFKPCSVTYSMWEVQKTLNLARVCPTIPIDKEVAIDFLHQPYLFDFYFGNDRSKMMVAYRFYEYLAFEFSRIDIYLDNEYDYMVSAIASKILSNMHFDGISYTNERILMESEPGEIKHFDGISYPSARSDGFGINFAIKPIAVDSKLKCVEVGEINVSCIKEKLNLNYTKRLKLTSDQKTFDLG